MTDDRYPLGEPHRPGTPVEQPEWLKKIRARNSDTGKPAGVEVDEHGRWRTVNHEPPKPPPCEHEGPIYMGYCSQCLALVTNITPTGGKP